MAKRRKNAREKRITIRLYEDEYYKLKEIVSVLGLTVSDLVREALREYLPKLGIKVEVAKTFWTFYEDKKVIQILYKIAKVVLTLKRMEDQLRSCETDAVLRHELAEIKEELGEIREMLMELLETLSHLSKGELK